MTTCGVFFLLVGRPLSVRRKTSTSPWEIGPEDGNSSQAVGEAGLLSEDKGETGEADDEAGEGEGEARRLEPEAGRMLRITAFQAAHLPERPRRG